MENKSAAGTGPDRRQSKRGRALSPSRLLILETLEAQAVPLTIAALTQRVGLHENTVRGHLDALLSDGFITRSPAEPDGRGRPSWLWQASTPSPQSAGALEYAGLAGALARTIALTAPDPVAAARDAGHAWGTSLAATDTITPARPEQSASSRVVQILDDLGFAPSTTSSAVVELRRCPILDAATTYPDVVCNVHMGLIAGVLDADGVDTEGSHLEPFSAPGVCSLHLVTRNRDEAEPAEAGAMNADATHAGRSSTSHEIQSPARNEGPTNGN